VRSVVEAATHPHRSSPHPRTSTRTDSDRNPFSRWALLATYHRDRPNHWSAAAQRIATLSRGGSSSLEEEDADTEDEYDEYDQYDDEEEEENDDDETDVEAEGDDTTEIADGVQIEVNVEKFDEPLVASPLSNLYASLAVMLLSRKIDIFHPTVVKIARFAFIAYLLLLQLFLFYVRVQAKLNNDRTPIELKNPLSSVLESQLGGGGGANKNNSMMKNLASSFLSSTSTVLEYDLKQARGMQNGLIFNMLFMWFLHFKMEQVQPLLIQTLNGLLTMVYSPLFQVYVLGRRLERPFKNPATKRMEEAAALQQQQAEAAAEEEGAESGDVATAVEEEEEYDDEDESDAVVDEDESEEEGSSNEQENDDDGDDEKKAEEAEVENKVEGDVADEVASAQDDDDDDAAASLAEE